MENQLKQYEYLLAQESRHEYSKNLYKVNNVESLSKSKNTLKHQQKMLLQLRSYQKVIQDMYESALQNNSDINKAQENETKHQREVNEKRNKKFKNEKEKELKRQANLEDSFLRFVKKSNGSIAKDIIHHAMHRNDGFDKNQQIKTYDVSQE